MTIRVLLADDHRVLREGLRALLDSEAGINVVGEAADGREAVRGAAELRPDVVVMDISMPILDGIEATRQIRQARPATNVVILSMHATAEHARDALLAGARGYLAKEAASQEVVNAVRAVRAGRPYLSGPISEAVIEDYVRRERGEGMATPLDRLSIREKQILRLIAEGRSTHEIGDLLFLSHKTVEKYRSRMADKLGLHDLAGIVKFAIRHGLVRLD